MIREEEKRQLMHLARRLEEEGFTQVDFQVVDTYMRLTCVVGDQVERRQDAVDRLYMAEAVKEGKKAKVYFTRLADAAAALTGLKGYRPVEDVGRGQAHGHFRDLGMIRTDFSWSDHQAAGDALLAAVSGACKGGKGSRIKASYEQYRVDYQVLWADGSGYGDTTGYHCLYTEALAGQGKEQALERLYQYGEHLQRRAVNAQMQQTLRNAAAQLEPKPIASGTYPVVIKNTVMAQMLEGFLPAFYGDQILSKNSVLWQALRERIGDAQLEIREVPTLPGGRQRRRIDDEGQPVREKALVKDGVFTNLLLDHKLARLLKQESTGNGFRPMLQAERGIGVTNVILEGREAVPYQRLLSRMGQGLLITQVSEVAAGLDLSTGQFALPVKGQLVQGGRAGQAFHRGVLVGNFLDLLQGIVGIGNDHAATGPDQECVLAPSVSVREMTVLGA